MKTAIYYFSGTGNNLAIARELSTKLNNAAELIPIAKLVQQETINASYDVVGFVYPVWLHYFPPIVEEFLKKINIKASYVFAIATYFQNASNSLHDFNSLLKQRGTGLDAGFLIKMPGKYVLLYDLTASEEESKTRIAEASARLKEISDIIEGKIPYGIEGEIGKDDKEGIINYHRKTYKVIEKFWTTDDCDLCGKCLEICPRNNIYISGRKITWNDQCDYCLACLHWCPKAAIHNGLSPKCKRYHHPNVTAEDIIQQHEKAYET